MASKQVKSIVVAALTALSLMGLRTVAQADPPTRTVTLTASNSPQSWQGDTATGANTDHNTASGTPCVDNSDPPAVGADPAYCDFTLLHVNLPSNFWNTQSGGVEVTLDNYLPPTSDFDLYIYKSDANGKIGNLVQSSGEVPSQPERASFDEPLGYYLIEVVYFAVTNGTYQGHAELFFRDKTPPDIDNPKGLQEVLASKSSAGWRSHSEPHIAQSPTNPNILVAGSKFFNKDPDSLNEYEFKIGTFVSFNGGRSWTDLGQLDVCPPSQAPPSSWPNNTCYPAEDPKRDGTGAEDPPKNKARGGGGDFAEEYITSDIWMQFDDEGNAYAMVLDSPPFESEAGWGMTLHKWRSVSKSDLKPGGHTWSRRIPINDYPEDFPRDFLGFLDDKNTFAVNNAGPDKDGETGIMIACWGQNVSAVIKQQEVCESSVDGGESWPDQPQPVSGVNQLVIGIDVIADRIDPLTFYATWLQYETTLATDLGTLEMAMTIDGGQTWTPPREIGPIHALPTKYPHQGFRNLSIPTMAVSEPSGGGIPVLYVVDAEYLPAPDPDNDEDDLQADIVLFRSEDLGLTWEKQNITEGVGPNENADQFQPNIAVTKTGQLDVFYFDRTLDLKKGSHPGNYFVDGFLARSNDDGATWTRVRLSHDMTDPEFNAPISSSGKFFGDYQGLVADDCVAIPFFNDTHLANDPYLDPGPIRDPDFDSLLRTLTGRQFQQTINFRVPNTGDFGGNGRPDLTPTSISSSETPTKGNETRLKATIRNLECIDAKNIPVRFLDNGHTIGTVTLGSIPGGGSRIASIEWTPQTTGKHVITVIVDPDEGTDETNEENNARSRTFTVRSGGDGGDD